MDEKLDERSVRLERLQKIESRGIQPYPSATARTHTVRAVLDDFDHLSETGSAVTVAGRIMGFREHGGSAFIDLEDGGGRMQMYFKKDVIDNFQSTDQHERLSYADFLEFIYIGDFVETAGSVFITKAGEKTVLVNAWRLISKAIRPVPSRWYGIQDAETRHRKRYLDFLLNPPLKEMFFRKARFWNSMREFLIARGFVEVYTPVLETTAGGADAEPFVTHYNALDMDVYLRISTGELWQKRLMVAGFEKTFEIGRQFRNEGIDHEHLQDYTQMECYIAYADYRQGMELTRELICYVTEETFGTLTFTIGEHAIDLSHDWGKIDFTAEVEKQTGINVLRASKKEMQNKLDAMGIVYEARADKGRLMDLLWKQCRKCIVGPAFLIHVPAEISPLAKRVPGASHITERFQLLLAGSELANGYGELNDPLDQRARFEDQQNLREAGDKEAQMYDADFIEALEYGMPPVCGLGISERLFAFFEGKSVRECTMFPLLKREHKLPLTIKDIKEQEAEFDVSDHIQIYKIGITRDNALQLLHEHIKNPNLIKHHLAVEIQMRALAEYFQKCGFAAINPDAWAMAGLLHDMDWEMTESEPKKHSLITAEILGKYGVHPAIVEAIRVHNHVHGIEPKTLMEKALYCAEELTGLVVAAALVQPEKKLASVDVPSVIKKFNDKAFARGVNREIILKCKDFLGMELDELISLTLRTMQARAKELGL